MRPTALVLVISLIFHLLSKMLLQFESLSILSVGVAKPALLARH